MLGNGLISDRELPICWANRRDGVVRACRNRTLYPSAIWSPLPEIVLDIDRGVTHNRAMKMLYTRPMLYTMFVYGRSIPLLINSHINREKVADKSPSSCSLN